MLPRMHAGKQIQPAYRIDDESLSETDLTSCTLLMMVGERQFNYAVLDPSENTFIALKTYLSQPGESRKPELELIEQCFDTDKLLYTAFQQTRIAFNVHKNVLVPARLYHPELKQEPLFLVHGEGPDEKVMTDEVPLMDLVNVYAVNRNILGYLKKEFPAAILCHAVTPLLNVLHQMETASENILYLLVQSGWFQTLVFSGGKLLYQRQMDYVTPLDIVYHTLNILLQLGLVPEQTRVTMSSDIQENAQIHEGLSGYYPILDWLERPAGHKYIDKFSNYPTSYFFHLFTIAS